MPRLPGECLDPRADAKRRAKLHESGAGSGSDHDFGEIESRVDLDGDGVADRAFALGLGVDVGAYLYVARGRCAHYVGDVGVSSFTASKEKHAGLVDLVTEDASHCEGDPGPCTPKKRTWRFNGTEYR